MNPTLDAYLDFLRTAVGIPVSALPDDSPWIATTYNASLELVYSDLAFLAPTLYSIAVYNLATAFLVDWASDVPPSTYFADARIKFGTGNFIPGLIINTGDESDNVAIMIPDSLKQLSLANLQQLKTPWGRAYLGIVQMIGNIWGLS